MSWGGASRLWDTTVRRLHSWGLGVAASRKPDQVIGGMERPYLRRWWVIPRNPVFNIYLHQVLRSDDDRALHDHPWFNLSLILSGAYVEHTVRAGGINVRRRRSAGALKLRSPWAAHRLELPVVRVGMGLGEQPCWTLFITGPRLRTWGFHCSWGWRAWREFTTGPRGETIGRGCD